MKQTDLDSCSYDLIFLVGFMGSGKTTVGRLLARKLGYRFQDLDELVETRASKTVSEIFAERGEEYFREMEREALKECRGMKRTVVALGGGAFVSEKNRMLLEGAGATVWLDCPLEVCLARLAGDSSRPLLANANDLRSLYELRRSAYEQASLVVQSAGKPPEEIAADIVELLISKRTM